MLNKSDLIKIVKDCGVNNTMATKIVDSLFDEMVNTLNNGEKVAIRFFGTFEPVSRQVRAGVINGHAYDAGTLKTVRFKPSKSLKQKELNV